MTPRQSQVLEQVCKGKSNKEIARTLGITEATVKLHLTAVFQELGVYTRWQAVAKAGHIDGGAKLPVYLTDQEILAEFANVTLENPDAEWSYRVRNFARRIIERTVSS